MLLLKCGNYLFLKHPFTVIANRELSIMLDVWKIIILNQTCLQKYSFDALTHTKPTKF